MVELIICKIPNERKKVSQEFRFKNVDETRNSSLEDIKQDELMGKKDKKVCATPIILNNSLF